MTDISVSSTSKTKVKRGRPPLTKEQKELRKTIVKQQNIQRLKRLREQKPNIVSDYSKRYYELHKEILRAKRIEMQKLYNLYKNGVISL